MYSINLDYKQLIDNFLKFKRSCGYKYHSEETTLKSFIDILKTTHNHNLVLVKNS
jgi:hypothetical protein